MKKKLNLNIKPISILGMGRIIGGSAKCASHLILCPHADSENAECPGGGGSASPSIHCPTNNNCTAGACSADCVGESNLDSPC